MLVIVQQFLGCNSGGRIKIWYQSRSQIKLKFLQMLDNLVKHISTKFRGIWICTLENMLIPLKGTKSVRKSDKYWIDLESL